jgi:hypothetical protein
MAGDRPSSSDSESRVVRFPSGRATVRWRTKAASPVDDLAKFERGEGVDDYRHRMTVNVAAFVFVLALIGAGLWLAETMAQLRKDEDCVLSGRRGCAPVEVNIRR